MGNNKIGAAWIDNTLTEKRKKKAVNDRCKCNKIVFAGRKKLILLYSTLEPDNKIQYLFYLLLRYIIIIIIILGYCMVPFLFLIFT